jgi:two-component system nitrate/nitrite response regulator NarL
MGGEGLASDVTVLVASDVRLYREGLELMLRVSAGIQVIDGTFSAATTLDRVQEARPAVVLLDMAMAEALTVARQMARQSRTTKVVALGMPEFDTEVL